MQRTLVARIVGSGYFIHYEKVLENVEAEGRGEGNIRMK
jgi:hypothetical protein